MTNKRVTSTALFGASTPAQIRGIQGEINAATAEILKDQGRRRALLRKIGALPEAEAKS